MSASQSSQSDDAGAAAQLKYSSAGGPVGLQDGGDHGDGRGPDEGPVGHAVIGGGGGAGGGFVEQCIRVGGQQQLPGFPGGIEGTADPAAWYGKRAMSAGDVRVVFRLAGDEFVAQVDGLGDHWGRECLGEQNCSRQRPECPAGLAWVVWEELKSLVFCEEILMEVRFPE